MALQCYLKFTQHTGSTQVIDNEKVFFSIRIDKEKVLNEIFEQNKGKGFFTCAIVPLLTKKA